MNSDATVARSQTMSIVASELFTYSTLLMVEKVGHTPYDDFMQLLRCRVQVTAKNIISGGSMEELKNTFDLGTTVSEVKSKDDKVDGAGNMCNSYYGSTQKAVMGNRVSINDGFWKQRMALVRETVIPFQWEALNDRVPGAEPSHAILNFRIAAGESDAKHGGLVFQDSDLAKWLEAVGFALGQREDPLLLKMADSVIDLIAKAQQPDGYLNTWFTIKEPGKRWTNLLDCHELYCAGHMMEAAVSYYEGTGKSKLLDVMCRFADYIAEVFGNEAGKIKGYDGHEEIELALVKLFRVTGNVKYLELSKFMIDARGQEPQFFLEDWERHGRISHWDRRLQTKEPDLKYFQSHMPVREQEKAVGHAVRAVYLYSGMADIALETADSTLKAACEKLFLNISQKQLYITGGIGQSVHGEAFTFDYDLPNDTVYQETCASIGLVFFAHRMLRFGANSLYSDVMEQALYNSVISGMSEDGKHYFYVNPLEAWPEASEKDPGKKHVLTERPPWYGCACCPPNLARLIMSLGDYVYSNNKDAVYVHLFTSSSAKVDLSTGSATIRQETDYPYSGKVKLTFLKNEARLFPEQAFSLGIRIPAWSKVKHIDVCGESIAITDVYRDGYACINRSWTVGDVVEIDFAPEPRLVKAHPKVRANSGKVALAYGPLTFCFEEADNGKDLPALSIKCGGTIKVLRESEKQKGTEALMLEVDGLREDEAGWSDGGLYKTLDLNLASIDTDKAFPALPVVHRAIPYFRWNNRGAGEMAVWLRLRK